MRVFRTAGLALILVLVGHTSSTYAQTINSRLLVWDEDSAGAAISGYAITVDGVRNDFGLSPVKPDGTCGCAVSAWFLGGRHTVVVSVYNSAEESSSVPFLVGPTAQAGGPYSGTAGIALNVSAAGSLDASATIVSYSWNWGDGTANTISSTASASHLYASAGSYAATVTVTDQDGATDSSAATVSIGGSGSVTDVVIYASDVPAANVHGTWSQIADSTAAGGIKLSNPDAGIAALSAPLPSPSNYFDTTFQAAGATRYRVWMRIHAIADSKWNDSVFVQYSDSVDSTGAAVSRIGTTGGLLVNLWTCSTCQSFAWGWQRNAYWLADTGDVWFQNSGAHTIRIQVREDGAEIDQIVLSPVTYATNPPGPVSNDTTIVPKPSPPSAPGTPNPANGATGVGINPTLTWSASGATSYDVSFGTASPPPLVVSGGASAAYTPPALTNNTTYFWQIVARNSQGSTTGTVWSFTTSVTPPATPNTPAPATGASAVATTVTLTWASAGATTYDVLFGPTDPPSQVASGLSPGHGHLEWGMDSTELSAEAIIAAAIITSHAVEIPAIPRASVGTNDTAARRLRELTEYVYQALLATTSA